MSLVFTEYFLYITMDTPQLGNKRYATTSGATHIIDAFTVKDRREAAVETQTTGQGSVPFSHTLGRMLDTIQIEFPIHNINRILDSLDGHRYTNTPKNIFLASTILTVTGNTYYKEFPTGSRWYVDTFSLKRNVQRHERIGTLSLKRWYGDLPE